MTGAEIYKKAASFVFQNAEDAQDTEEFAADWLNAVLFEALPYENSLRRYGGLEELAAPPCLTSLDEDIDWHDVILYTALPYAIAAHIWRADDNNYRANTYQQMYINALMETQKLFSEDIEDVY